MNALYADTVLVNGRIATLDPSSPEANAVALRDGRFLAVGDEHAMRAHAGPATRTIDLQNRTVIPGLNDSHIHVIRGGLPYSQPITSASRKRRSRISNRS